MRYRITAYIAVAMPDRAKGVWKELVDKAGIKPQ